MAKPVLLALEEVAALDTLEYDYFIYMPCCGGSRFKPCPQSMQVPSHLLDSPSDLAAWLDDSASWRVVVRQVLETGPDYQAVDPETGETRSVGQIIEIPVIGIVCPKHARELGDAKEDEDDG